MRQCQASISRMGSSVLLMAVLIRTQRVSNTCSSVYELDHTQRGFLRDFFGAVLNRRAVERLLCSARVQAVRWREYPWTRGRRIDRTGPTSTHADPAPARPKGAELL